MKRILRRILFIGAALVLALDAWLYLPGFLSGPQELTGETEVHFIDVGQGDSILLLSVARPCWWTLAQRKAAIPSSAI